MKISAPAALLVSALAFAPQAQAATFAISWSSDTGTETTDPSMSVTGVMELDVADGEDFDIFDLVSLTFSVIGDTINDFVLDFAALDINDTPTSDLALLEGTVSADGTTASLTDFLFSSFGGDGFGCDFADCVPGNSSRFEPLYNIVSGRQISGNAPNGNRGTTLYASAADALASISLTRLFDDPDPVDPDPDPLPTPEVVPLPATAPLLLGAVGALAFWRRRRAAKA